MVSFSLNTLILTALQYNFWHVLFVVTEWITSLCVFPFLILPLVRIVAGHPDFSPSVLHRGRTVVGTPMSQFTGFTS